MATKRFYNPDELMFDDGRTADTRNLRGAGLAVAGKAQARQRNPFARSMGPGWDSYFGLLQAKENAANAAGKHFNIDVDTWGNDPRRRETTVFEEDQVPSSVAGIYNRAGLTAGQMLKKGKK